MLFTRRKPRLIFNQAWRKAHSKRKDSNLNASYFSQTVTNTYVYPNSSSASYTISLENRVSSQQAEMFARELADNRIIPYNDTINAVKRTPVTFGNHYSEERLNQFKDAALKAGIVLSIEETPPEENLYSICLETPSAICSNTPSASYTISLENKVSTQQAEVFARELANNRIIPYNDTIKATKIAPVTFGNHYSEERLSQFKDAASKAGIVLSIGETPPRERLYRFMDEI